MRCSRAILTVLVLSTIVTSGCKDVPVDPAIDTGPSDYLVLGHIYRHHTTDRIDSRLEGHDYSGFEGILLGGDICTETTRSERTLDYIDEIFDIGNPRTLWTPGNHDLRNGNTHRITDRTGRELFYTSRFDGVQWVVLYTPFDLEGDHCARQAEQWNMLTNVLDTVSSATSLVLFMHSMMWGDVNQDTQRAKELANADKSWLSFVCDSSRHFAPDVYPLLSRLPDKGIQTIVISGDGGQLSKQYRYVSPESIEFYITGINNSLDTLKFTPSYPANFNPDSILLFRQDEISGRLEHEFIRLSEFIE